VLFKDGAAVAVQEGEGRAQRFLAACDAEEAELWRRALVRGRMAPLVRTYLGKTRARPAQLGD